MPLSGYADPEYGDESYGSGGAFFGFPNTPLPAFQVLVAFQNNATDDPALITGVAAPGDLGGVNVWSDITPYVESYTTHRGRQHELDHFEAAKLTLEVNNNDGRFNPWNTASPYYGFIKPLRPIQVRATYGPTTYYRFTGLVTAWPIQWNDPASAWATIEAADAFYFLNQVDIGNTGYKTIILGDSPKAYWRLGDVFGSATAADSSGNGYTAAVAPSVTFGGPQALLSDTNNSVVLNGSGFFFAPTTAALTGTGPWSVEGWVNTSTNDANERAIYSQISPDGTVELFFGIVNGLLTVGYPYTGGSAFTNDVSGTVADGKWHYVFAAYDGTYLFVGHQDQGIPITGLTSALPGSSYNLIANQPGGQVTIGSLPGGTAAGVQPGIVGDLQDVATYTHSIQLNVQNHWAPGTYQWFNAPGSTRIGNVLDVIGWPSAARNIDTNTSQTILAGIASSLLTTSALAHLQSVEETEAGALFMDTQGRVRWIARQSLLVPPYTTTQVTLGDNPGELTWEPGPDMALDDLDLVNQEQVTGAAVLSLTGGPLSSVTQSWTDPTSAASYGLRSRSLNCLNELDQDSLYHAQWDVGRLSQPLLRLRRIDINPLDDIPNLFPAVLSRELLDRVTVNRHSVPGGGDAFTQVALIEGMEEKVSASDGWTVSWSLSPTDAVSAWILGDSTFGVLDSTTKLGW